LKKEIWVDLSSGKWSDKKEKLTTALENGITTVILNSEDIPKARKIGQFKIGSYTNNFQDEKPDFIIINQDRDPNIKIDVARKFVIETNEDLLRIQKQKDKYSYFIIKAEDWKIIPLENLIAEFQKTNSKLISEVENIADAKLFLETLEKGTDGVLFINPSINKIREISKIIDKISIENIQLNLGKIITIKPLSSGDRVCVDTCSMLKIGEGMLIGSQSNGMFLVHSESLESEYVASRPFRVNAGPVHSYVQTPGNKTRYLSELKAGDEILIVNRQGETRTAVVGRVKIEIRPLILIEAEVEGNKYKIILQNAETIRLVNKDGKPVSITQLKIDDEILLYVSDSGRHFGTEIEETIIER
jgi:3-dehydroquinate synthase II